MPQTQSPYFKSQAPITFGSNLGTASPAPATNPSIASGLSIGTGGNLLSGGQPIQPQNVQTANALTSALLPTSSGGVKFPASAASTYNTPAPIQTTTSQPTSGAAGLAQYTLNHSSTPNGGTLAMNANGSPVGYSPSSGYSINTSNPAPSDALGGNTLAGLQNSHNSYSDYVNALSQAQGYNQNYIGALQGQYGAQTQGAQLGLNQAQYGMNTANINANYATGIGTTGLTGSQAQTLTGQEQALNAQGQARNTLAQAGNSIQQLAANQALNTQQLSRTGAISAAQTQLQYSPQGQAGSNAISQYNSLQQAYPGANIPEYNQSLTPEQNQQVASYIVANSPAYKAQFQSTYQTAGGGTGIYNKLDTGGLTHNQDGTISLVNDGAAITGAADKSAANTLTSQINSLTPAYNAANQDFTYLTNFMQSAGINQSNIPAINQVQQAIQAKVLDPGALAEFKAGIASLRTNYAALLGSRGETPTQAGSDAQALVPDTLNPAQLTQVQNALNVNGKNIIDANQSQLQNILSKYGGQAGSTNLNAGSSANGGWGSLGD